MFHLDEMYCLDSDSVEVHDVILEVLDLVRVSALQVSDKFSTSPCLNDEWIRAFIMQQRRSPSPLKEIHLDQTAITSQGFRELIDYFGEGSMVTDISVNGGSLIDDDGMQYLVERLPSLPNLSYLSLTDFKGTMAMVPSLIQLIRSDQFREIEMDLASLTWTDEILEALRSTTKLEDIHINDTDPCCWECEFQRSEKDVSEGYLESRRILKIETYFRDFPSN
jgi:hypothetical protein